MYIISIMKVEFIAWLLVALTKASAGDDLIDSLIGDNDNIFVQQYKLKKAEEEAE